MSLWIYLVLQIFSIISKSIISTLTLLMAALNIILKHYFKTSKYIRIGNQTLILFLKYKEFFKKILFTERI